MKKIILMTVVVISCITFAQQFDELFNNLLLKSEDFVSFSGAGFDARFVPTYAATDSEIRFSDGQNLLGILVVRSTRVMDIEINNVVIINSEDDSRVAFKIYKVEDLTSPVELPFSLPSGGVLVLTSETPLQDYFMDIRIQQILLPWRVKTSEPDRVVEMAPVTLVETASEVDVEGNDNYDSLTVSISDLNDRLDFLQDNVEGLNLQFRRLNTLFLDTQVALAEYKAAVDEGAFDTEEFAMTIENRLTALEESVVDNPITRIEFEELSESLDRLYSSLAEWSDEISKIETLEASQTGLQLSIENLENTVKSLREITPQQSDSEDIVSINDKIGEITTSLSAAENELQEMKSFIGLQSEEISTVRNELGDALDSLTARLNFVELSAKTSSESIGTNNELLAEITAEVDALSDYVSEQALSQMEKFSSLSEAFSDIEKRVIAAETSLSDFEEIKARLSASESATRILSDRISSLEAFYSSAEDIIPILEEKVGNLETSVFGTGKINMDELETEILQLREIADSLSRGFVKFNSELITLRESIPPEGVSIETFENSINELSDAIININADLSEIRSSVAELELSLGVLEDSLVGVSVGLDSMKGNFDGSVAAIDSNLKAIQKIENDLLLTQEDLAKTRDQLSTLTKELEKTLVTREEIITITEEAVKQSREATAQEISSLRRTNNIWLTVAVISSLAAIVLGVVNILP
ncbi:hypothetical protein [Mesotoga prima]|uniref:hypothetical protein n=1 Tax=Mesotoga prima TaxID=1184387 RepID=UPI00259587F5|nr:hypothetical protein [Mesotoga prima]HOP37977.1 hypothetical protein [Mesotoga prima]HPJ32494.1 hypothetical protein [Mesotoga prima]HPQ91605.1 hypothetical protein [Mesotoga prima]